MADDGKQGKIHFRYGKSLERGGKPEETTVGAKQGEASSVKVDLEPPQARWFGHIVEG